MSFATPRPLNLSINPVFGRIITLSAILSALHSLPALASDHSEVGKLTQSGQYSEALAKANAYLTQQPQDAQMRFLKGLILTEQNKSAEAIVVFTKLTEDFPRLPEPYNNLGVLLAATNQYEKSRTALEMAIRTNPAYATAHENLGDIYAKLASQAYDKALQLDTSNAAAKSKLTLIHTLVNSSTTGTPRKTETVAAVAAKPPAPVVAAAAGNKSAPVAAKAEPAVARKPAAQVEPNPPQK